MLKGTPKADGVALMSISHISFLAGAANPTMQAKCAYIKSDTGATLGYIEHNNWSKETLQRLAELRAAMEQDIADLYLGVSESAGAVDSNEPKGIADHLGTDDAPPG